MILSMKTLKRTIIGLASLAVLFTACNDFEEINKDPNAVDESAIKVSYLLNKSIMGAQQNPHIAERVFVYQWKSGVILLNLPLALIGGVFALMITTGEISIPAIIGFISLFGIATRNGMLLISHYNTLREEGMDLKESILHGSLDRLNPILMTALSSALALIPLAFRGDLPGNEIQSPMAKVILGGLLTSTFLNAFIIPIVYELMNRKKK